MVKWWKDRDKLIPGEPDNNPPRQHDDDPAEEQDLPGEDIGDVGDDDTDELDDIEPPDRGIDT